MVQTTKEQRPSWPTGREVMTTSSCWVRGYNSTPSPTVQSTPVKVKFFKKYLSEGMSDPGKIIRPGR